MKLIAQLNHLSLHVSRISYLFSPAQMYGGRTVKGVGVLAFYSNFIYWKVVYIPHHTFTKLITLQASTLQLVRRLTFQIRSCTPEYFQSCEKPYDLIHEVIYGPHLSRDKILCQKICKQYLLASNPVAHVQCFKSKTEGVKIFTEPLIRVLKFI